MSRNDDNRPELPPLPVERFERRPIAPGLDCEKLAEPRTGDAADMVDSIRDQLRR